MQHFFTFQINLFEQNIAKTEAVIKLRKEVLISQDRNHLKSPITDSTRNLFLILFFLLIIIIIIIINVRLISFENGGIQCLYVIIKMLAIQSCNEVY